MSKFSFVIKRLWKGESVTRAYLNFRLSKDILKGKTIDIGGGKSADYISFMETSKDIDFQTFDVKFGQSIDFEKDSLPSTNNSYETVLFLNVMEHIFNYQHIANEVVRITKPGGQLIGFVPFLMWYHPDHRDFFRYTHESLELIFKKAGIIKINVESISEGPFVAMTQMVGQLLPSPLMIIFFIINYSLDKLYLKLRPNRKGIYALGYYFVINKI